MLYGSRQLPVRIEDDRSLTIAVRLKNTEGNMRIEHIAMYVDDLEAAREFFLKYLDGHSNDGYHNVKTGFRSYFISFDDGARLELMNKPDVADTDKTSERTGYAHIAFIVGSREKVDSLTECLRLAGYRVKSGPRMTGDGYYESCIVAIESNQIEITVWCINSRKNEGTGLTVPFRLSGNRYIPARGVHIISL